MKRKDFNFEINFSSLKLEGRHQDSLTEHLKLPDFIHLKELFSTIQAKYMLLILKIMLLD